MIWIKVFDVFDNMKEKEEYKKKCKKKIRTSLKKIWMINEILCKDRSF